MSRGTVDFYKQKTWCDAKDGMGVWRLGRIKRKVKTRILVHFDGWSDKWEQWYCLHSELIAPIRMHSRGYTGQTKVALRKMDFSEDSLKTMESKIKLLKHNDLTGLSPYDLTILIRGDLFVLIDYLLTYTYSNPSIELLKVNDLLLSVLELIIKWLQLAPQYHALRIDEPHAYLSDRNSSIYCLGNELIEILISILGLNPRTSKFFEKYKNFTSVKTFVTNFLNKGGMKALLAITKSEMPVEDIWKLSVNIPSIFSINTTSANDRYLPEYIDGLIEKFNNISYEALSTISENKQELKRFVDNMENITDLIYEDAQKNKVLQFFTQKLKVEVVASPRYSMISNRDQANIAHQNAMRLPTPHSLTAAQIQGVQSSQMQQIAQNSMQGSSGNTIQVTSANPLQMSVGNPIQVTTASSMQISSGNSMMPHLASSSSMFPLAHDVVGSVQIPSMPSSQAFALSQSVPITPKQRNILRHATQGMKLDIPDEESFKFELSSNRESLAFKSNRFSVIDPRLSVQESRYNPIEPIMQGPSIDSIVSELKHLIETRHKECIDLISASLNNELSRKSDNDYKLDEIFKSHSSCDQQEFAVLSSLEYWLQENKIEEALRLVTWRKKILKIAKMNGWPVAREIAKRTLSTLYVTSMDLIEGNMRVVLNNANSLEKVTED